MAEKISDNRPTFCGTVLIMRPANYIDLCVGIKFCDFFSLVNKLTKKFVKEFFPVLIFRNGSCININNHRRIDFYL